MDECKPLLYGPNKKKSKVSTVARGTATTFSGSDMPTSPNGKGGAVHVDSFKTRVESAYGLSA